MPWVTESVNVPSGLPMAMASCPTRTVLESPRVTGVSPATFTLIRARSCRASVLTTEAATWRVSSSVTVSEDAPAMTWQLVRIRPSAATTKPDPAPLAGTENGVTPVTPAAVIVTTDGLTIAATRTMASDWVRLISCASAGLPAAAGGGAGLAMKTTTYVPAAAMTAESSAVTSTRPATLRPSRCRCGPVGIWP